jgi:hypothetical protein
LHGGKVSVLAKSVDAILMHELRSAGSNAQAGALWSLSHRRLAQGRGQ